MIDEDDCGQWLWSATDRQQHRHHHQTPTKRTTTDGAYMYLIDCNVNSMHNSSRHQQFKLPSPAGAEQALRGASDD